MLLMPCGELVSNRSIEPANDCRIRLGKTEPMVIGLPLLLREIVAEQSLGR
jgi:hypothetical protein